MKARVALSHTSATSHGLIHAGTHAHSLTGQAEGRKGEGQGDDERRRKSRAMRRKKRGRARQGDEEEKARQGQRGQQVGRDRKRWWRKRWWRKRWGAH
jgi:hypothetical protein